MGAVSPKVAGGTAWFLIVLAFGYGFLANGVRREVDGATVDGFGRRLYPTLLDTSDGSDPYRPRLWAGLPWFLVDGVVTLGLISVAGTLFYRFPYKPSLGRRSRRSAGEPYDYDGPPD